MERLQQPDMRRPRPPMNRITARKIGRLRYTYVMMKMVISEAVARKRMKVDMKPSPTIFKAGPTKTSTSVW